MKKLTIGLVLVILLLLSASCTTEATESEVEAEKPMLTEEQQELWLERGVIPVATIEEASRLVGYPVAEPTYLPLGKRLQAPPHSRYLKRSTCHAKGL